MAAMHRQWWARPLAILMALWLSLTLGEPGVVHFCPMHGGGAGARAVGHGVGHDATTHAATQQHRAPPGHGHAGCTCLGACSVTGFGPVLPSVAAPVPVAPISVPTAAPPAERAGRRPSPDRLLPFANGPPATAGAA